MRCFLLLLTFLSFRSFGQELVLKRSISWSTSRNVNEIRKTDNKIPFYRKYLYFENAVYKNQETLFPYYYELIKGTDYYDKSQIKVKDIEYQIVDRKDLENVLSLDILPDTFIFKTYIVTSQKIPAVALNILPLRRNDKTNSIERITSFSIEIAPKTSPVVNSVMAFKNAPDFKEVSVLASGSWFKIAIRNSGIYKLTYNDLIDMGITNPENIRIYGNGGENLSMMNNNPRPDDLLENPVYMEKGSDGIFNSGDYILFYGKGIVSWKYDKTEEFYNHSLNAYSGVAWYYLTSSLGPGEKIESAPLLNNPADTVITTFDDYSYHEKNLYNLIQSGRQWLGERLDIASSFDTVFSFPNLVTSYPVLLKVNVASRSAYVKTFTIAVNNQFSENISVSSINLNATTGTYAQQNHKLISFLNNNDNLSLKLTYNKTESSDEGYLDFITVNVRRNLLLAGSPLFFRNIRSVKNDRIAEFRIQNAGEETIIWDVTDIEKVHRVFAVSYSQGISFKDSASALREYAAFNKNMDFPRPIIDMSNIHIENQNLHGVASHKMLIVTHPLFLKQAERLADFHRTRDNYSVYVTTTENIYNEFSSGIPDICAIRDFARMLYQRSDSDENALKYLLLFGDGSYNNFSRTEGNPNFVPTYQSAASMTYTSSYVSDDFYGLLDINEGGGSNMSEYMLDIGIGRLPVGDTLEANAVLNKIISYNSAGNMQDWRNTLLFIGDDQDSNEHMKDANNLADYIRSNYPGFEVKKILLDAYKQVSTSAGSRYPDVNKAILDNFNKGILIFNYNGHGSENGIAEEVILRKQDLENLKNKDKYPLLITATCEFSRWDNMLIDEQDGKFKEQSSAGEAALLNENGGAIALFSTTRVVWAIKNYELNREFYYKVFQRDENGNRYRMGDIIRLSKNGIGDDSNKLNFTLLGDPAMQLAYPEFQVITDSVNGTDAGQVVDTLKAFKEVTVSGHVVDQNNLLFSNFNGIIYPSVFDKVQSLTTLANDPTSYPMTFSIQENILFKGKASVNDGRFRFKFIVPKDISYTTGPGKIIYYAQNGNIDAHGYFTDFLIGGTSVTQSGDLAGPEVDLYLNDENFKDGGISDKDPVVYATVWDESGINTTGNGIGHEITGVIDGDSKNPVILNDYYQTNLDDYRGGEVIYQMNDLAPGYHSLSLKIWDIFNNSSERIISFKVIDADGMILEKVYNFPNPVIDHTYFQFEHNMPDKDLIIKIDIFDFSGRLIRTIRRESYATGYRSEPVEWDGRDNSGNKLSRGIYPYRLSVETTDGQYAERFEKLLVLN